MRGYIYNTNPYILPPSQIYKLALGQMSQAAFLAGTTGGGAIGLTYTRPQVGGANLMTVQTSLATRIDNLSGAQDLPLIGNAGFGRGLVIEGNSLNYIGTGTFAVADPSNAAGAGFFASGGTQTHITTANAAGPNPAGNYNESRFTLPTNLALFAQSGGGGYLGAGKPICASVWEASPLNAAASGIGVYAADGTFSNVGSYARPVAIQPWQRAEVPIVETGATQFYIGNSGSVPAFDLLMDSAQIDSMPFACEFKPGVGAGAIRTADHVRYVGGATLSAASGRLSVWLEFSPKCGTGATNIPPVANATTFTLCAFPGGFVRVNLASFKIEAQMNGGAVQTSTNAIAFSRGDNVQFFVSMGNSTNSVCKYKIGAGAWVDLVLTAFPAYVGGPGDLWVFGTGSAVDNVWCWAIDTATYKPGRTPAGA